MSDTTETEIEPEGGTDVQTRIATVLDSIEGRWYQFIFFVGLLAWVVGLLVVSLPWNWIDRLVPTLVGGIMIVLLVVKLFKIVSPDRYRGVVDFWGGSSDEPDEEGDALQKELLSMTADSEHTRPRLEQFRYAIRMIGWALALPVMMFYIGIGNGLVLFLFGFGIDFFDSVTRAAAVTVLFSLIMYVFFMVILGIDPWRGALDVPNIVDLV